MRHRTSSTPPQCRAVNGGTRCERPTHDGGPHRAEILDDHGQPTGRYRSWYDRWVAA